MALASDRAFKKGHAAGLVLALLEDQARHGYESGKLIAERAAGGLRFHRSSLGPRVYRRERRYYRLTHPGRRKLADERSRSNLSP